MCGFDSGFKPEDKESGEVVFLLTSAASIQPATSVKPTYGEGIIFAEADFSSLWVAQIQRMNARPVLSLFLEQHGHPDRILFS